MCSTSVLPGPYPLEPGYAAGPGPPRDQALWFTDRFGAGKKRARPYELPLRNVKQIARERDECPRNALLFDLWRGAACPPCARRPDHQGGQPLVAIVFQATKAGKLY